MRNGYFIDINTPSRHSYRFGENMMFDMKLKECPEKMIKKINDKTERFLEVVQVMPEMPKQNHNYLLVFLLKTSRNIFIVLIIMPHHIGSS